MAISFLQPFVVRSPMTRRGHTVSERVIQRVVSETDTDPVELPPLFNTVDPDALNAIIETLSEGEISFDYVGYTVTVDADGNVRIREPSTGSEPVEGSVTRE